MELNMSGKRVLITGGSKGIGYACAEVFAEEGCDVQLVSRTEADLKAAADKLRERFNVPIAYHALDLSDSSNIAKLQETCGDIDILVNNAGAIPGGTLFDVDETRWREAWDLKIFGYINMVRTFYTKMAERGGGAIVNVIGLAGEKPDFGYVAGSTGNSGLMTFTKAIGGSSLKDNIRVLAVNPGPVQTDRLISLLKTRSEGETGSTDGWERYMETMPMGRAAYPREVADVVAFLASERASYLTGIVVPIEGGMANKSASF
ncbi:MAG: SDR family oxidoreductase [Rhodospirillaceae bacterium]|nr:SDR family oxidoreductase [Rhodospirillaceae bacterium]MBT6136646.1 SDR family oxidoreductase [Rhodospirillaceae bacterium]